MSDDFTWNNESISIPVQGAIAVHLNTYGDLVIREQGDDGDDDNIIIIRKANIPDLLLAITNATEG